MLVAGFQRANPSTRLDEHTLAGPAMLLFVAHHSIDEMCRATIQAIAEGVSFQDGENVLRWGAYRIKQCNACQHA